MPASSPRNMSAVPWLFSACESTRRSPISRAIAIARSASSIARLGVVCEQGELRLVAEGHREQARVAGVGEHGGCLAGGGLGVGASTAEPLEPRQPAQARAEPSRVAELPAQRDGLATARRPRRRRADRCTTRSRTPPTGRRSSAGCVAVGVRRAPPGSARPPAGARRTPRHRARRAAPTRRPRRRRPPRARGARAAPGRPRPRPSSAASTRRSSSMRRDAGSASTIARRVSSWRNRTPSGLHGEETALLRGAQRALGPRHEPGEQVGGRRPTARRRAARRGPASRRRGAGGARSRRRRPSAAPVASSAEATSSLTKYGFPSVMRVDAIGVEPAAGRQRADGGRRQARAARCARRGRRGPGRRAAGSADGRGRARRGR